jgi:hypothetical protein
MMGATAVEQLNTIHYLYLRELSEPQDNSLKIIVEEAVVNQSRVANFHPELSSELQAILKDASPIESVEGCRVFELYWKRYAAYLVTEELVGSNSITGYSDETYTGSILRLYTKSHFLGHLVRDTGGHTEPLQHYKLVCPEHLIDVASYAPPEVRAVTEQSGASTQSKWLT